MGAAGCCFHCGAAIPAGVELSEQQGAATLRFCCGGCQGAYLLISGAGLGEFYRRRDRREAALPSHEFASTLSDSYLSRFVYQANDCSAIDVVIDGIHCASCVWLNEKMLAKLTGVREARVNYATGRARVLFAPEIITPAAIFTRIAELGYLPRPYTLSAAREGAGREQKSLLIRFGTAFFLTMQLMAYSFALYAGYFQGMETRSKMYLQLFSLLVTTPVVFYCGWPFLTGAWRGVTNRAPNMELLISIGALSSYGYSLYAIFSGGEVYFETAAMIVTLILAGRLLENAARRRAAAGVERLLGLCAGQARRLRGGLVETVDIAELAAGDLIEVSPGDRFPVDGQLQEGTTDVDESPATGESLPVVKGAGDAVIAGSCNLTGTVRVVCAREAAESFIARVARLVEDAQSRRAPIQGVADQVSALFVPVVLALALATLLIRCLAGASFGLSLMNALAVVVIACPCALGLATPTAILAGTGAAAARGVIFKGGDILERLAAVTVAVFDKTGTLTCGKPALVQLRPVPGCPERELLSLAAAVESGSLHPIGKAIVERAAAEGIVPPGGHALKTFAGGGVTGTVSGCEVAVGSEQFLAGLGVRGITAEAAPPDGAMVACVAVNGSYRGCFVLNDSLRADAPDLVTYFKQSAIGTLLLSGDRQQAAERMASLAGIETGIGRLTPQEKGKRIEELRKQGEIVLMVGDGINDAPALSAADVGCAVAGGTDIAIETSDLVLAKPDLERLAAAHRMARRTMAVVKQNLVWAFLYNLVGIPLAMSGKLTPIYAAAAMALSSLCVVGNSLRLLGVKRG